MQMQVKTRCGHLIAAEFVPAANAAVGRLRTLPKVNTASRIALARCADRGNHNFVFEGTTFAVDKNVFSPAAFAESATFTRRLARGDIDLAGKDMLEVGPGIGFTGLYLLKNRDLKSLTAVDISPDAVRCTRKNAEQLSLQDRVTVLQGDVFGSLPTDRKFDVIWWSYPWSPEDRSYQCSNMLERSVFDPGYEGLDKYVRDAAKYTKAGGRTFIGFGDFGDTNAMRKIARSYNYQPVEIFRAQPPYKKYNIYIYELRPQGAAQSNSPTHLGLD